jgi:hypothetical protein
VLNPISVRGVRLELGPKGGSLSKRQRYWPRAAAATPRRVGMLVHLVSVGLVAATIIGVFFGTGFFLLGSPASERITDRYPPHVYGNGAERGRQAVLVSHLAAVNVLPGSPLNQRPAVDEAVPLAQSTAVQEFPPARPNGDPPVAASVPEPASDSVPPPASPTPSANPPPFVAEVSVLPAGAKARPARDGHYAHTHTASRHSRPTFHPRRTKA